MTLPTARTAANRGLLNIRSKESAEQNTHTFFINVNKCKRSLRSEGSGGAVGCFQLEFVGADGDVKPDCPRRGCAAARPRGAEAPADSSAVINLPSDR